RALFRSWQRARRARLPRHLPLRPLDRRGDPEARGGPAARGRRGSWVEHKETQPPSRIGQGKLIELMEERGLGTKATRHDIIQKLYDRGYINNNPIEPSETGIAMVKAFKRYADRMVTPEMTAELEADMDRIASR